MKHDPIPQHVRRLLGECFSSVSEVETLVLLVRTGRRWSAREVAREFVLDEVHATGLLRALVAIGLVRVADGQYEFHPTADGDRAAAAELASLYPTYRTRVRDLVLARGGGATCASG